MSELLELKHERIFLFHVTLSLMSARFIDPANQLLYKVIMKSVLRSLFYACNQNQFVSIGKRKHWETNLAVNHDMSFNPPRA